MADAESILAFADILNNGCISTSLLFYFADSGFFVFLALLYRAFRKNPAFVLVLIVLIQQQNLPSEYWYLMMSDSYYSKPQREEYFVDSGYYKFHEAYHMLKFANET